MAAKSAFAEEDDWVGRAAELLEDDPEYALLYFGS
jgi:hypothetical protein